MDNFGTGSHDDHDVLGIRMTEIVEQPILAADDSGEFVHASLDDIRSCDIESVYRFARLEEDVRILRCSFDRRTIRGEGILAVLNDQILREHIAHVVERNLFDFLDFVRRPETVEEVNHRNAAFQSGSLGDERHVHDFLHRAGSHQAESGRSRRHNVGMVTEYREGVRSDRTGRYMKHGGSQFAGDLEHVRDHQQQPL